VRPAGTALWRKSNRAVGGARKGVVLTSSPCRRCARSSLSTSGRPVSRWAMRAGSCSAWVSALRGREELGEASLEDPRFPSPVSHTRPSLRRARHPAGLVEDIDHALGLLRLPAPRAERSNGRGDNGPKRRSCSRASHARTPRRAAAAHIFLPCLLFFRADGQQPEGAAIEDDSFNTFFTETGALRAPRPRARRPAPRARRRAKLRCLSIKECPS
jgi:hypothetical protein